jgi:trimethylamine--corrinoid protein Co-methyltransferase
MSRPRLDCLSAVEKDALHQRVLHILEHVGVGVGSSAALDLLAEAGARVDRETGVAKLPPELVETCRARVPRRIALAAREPALDLVVGDGSPMACCTDGMGTKVLDDATGTVRAAEWADLDYYYTLLDALPEVDFLWTSLTPAACDPVTGGLKTDLMALESTSKHVQSIVAHSPEQVPPLLEMLEAIAAAPLRERPIYSSLHCPVSPLQFESEKLDASIALARRGVPINIHPLPLMGSTAPMSVLGTAVVSIAEFLAGVAIFQLASPGCALMVAATGAVADRRTGAYLCGAPEVALLDMTCLSMSAHYGLPSMSAGISSDAKTADFQSGAEGAMTAMAAVLAGADVLVGIGLLQAAQVISTAKVMLDCDTVGALRRLLTLPDVDDDATLLADIAAVGPAGHFLGRRSSREGSRRGEIWRPSVFRRGGQPAPAERPLVADALDRAQAVIAAHVPNPIPDDVRRDARAVLAEYARVSGHPIH